MISPFVSPAIVEARQRITQLDRELASAQADVRRLTGERDGEDDN